MIILDKHPNFSLGADQVQQFIVSPIFAEAQVAKNVKIVETLGSLQVIREKFLVGL